ncbi:MAG: hypothetical protein JW909_11515 [Planctomycetes bacterium]|nr:hypothetical protein [Planctomycetota bacterium]
MPETENTGLLIEIQELFRRVDEELPRYLCEACGRCCNFRDAGHILFVTELERIVFADRFPAYPVFSQPPDVCPFMVAGKCTARDVRPLACRTYFCREPRAVREERYERYLKMLKALGRRYGIPYSYHPLFWEGCRPAARMCGDTV